MGGGQSAECKWGEFLMADYLTTDTELTSVANAIRTKGGTSASLVYPAGFVSAIEAISADYPSANGVDFGTVVSTISFNISGTSYTADSGMTWGQWVASAYNTNGFYASNNIILTSDAGSKVNDPYVGIVSTSTAIVADRSYTLSPNLPF